MLENQSLLRLVPFIGVLCIMMLWETWAPRRVRVENRTRRTFHNLGLTIVNSLSMRLLPVLSAVGAASFATRSGIGLFNWIELPSMVEMVLAIILFDMLIYWQHVAAHHLPMLWKLHQVHHADHDLDASSGLRFHPLEIMFSMALKSVGAIVLGAPAEAVLIFEIVLNACAIFNHSNVHIPQSVERWLRLMVVTPDMHRIHHSIERDETNSNYGFNIPWWDHLFGSYRENPRGPQESLKLGLPEYPQEQQTIPLWSMLWMPFAKAMSFRQQPEPKRPG